MPEKIVNNPKLYILLSIGILVLCYVIYKVKKAIENSLKKFSAEFLKLTSNNPKRIAEYHEYLMWKLLCNIKTHNDFSPFRGTRFLNDLVTGFKKRSIPHGGLYGFCAILTVNYSKIRNRIINPLFLPEVQSIFSEVYPSCDVAQIKNVFSNARNIISHHETILEYSHEELRFALEFMKLYFLYLYSLENPEMAKSLDLQSFYNFPVSDPIP